MKCKIGFPALFAILVAGFFGCYRMKGIDGGGEIGTVEKRQPNGQDIALPPGYQIESVADGFTFPSALEFDEDGNMYVLEAGYCYGEIWTEPKLLKLGENGTVQTIATGTKNGPWTGLDFHDGAFYVAEGGTLEGGKILKISKDGKITTLIEDLPTTGDHHTNGPVVKDNHIYFGLGVATNSGVVGEDNEGFGWLKRDPKFHDIPCQDVVLNGTNYESENVLTEVKGDNATTGAYVSFNTPTTQGQVIKGSIPCTGSILRIPLKGGNPELVAWGLRNPFGLALSPSNKVFITENAYDERGSRPVWGAGEVLWEIKDGTWYGWPDFSEGKPIESHEFKVPGEGLVKPLLQKHPQTPPKPTAILGVHASACGLDFSKNTSFGYEGEAFIAEFGDMAPTVGKTLAPVGFKVVRVNVETGVVMDFAVNKGSKNGPASWLGKNGLERPVAIKFDPKGQAMYIVDFGIVKMTDNGAVPIQKTGNIWKVTKLGNSTTSSHQTRKQP